MAGESLCPHGMAGFCPDCAPDRFAAGHDMAAPTAKVLGRTEWPFVVVRRTKADGSLDWFTYHWTHRGARRAADLYLRTGCVVGHRP